MPAVLCALGMNVFAAMVCAGAAEDSDRPIDEAAAQERALTDAQVSEADAQRLRTKPEREDGEDVIEVEFSCDGLEYEYVIRTWDGMILEWSIEGADVDDAVAEQSLAAGTDAEDSQQAENPDPAQDDGSRTAGETGARIAADGTELIGFAAAKEIVLQDSGALPEDAVFTKIKFEYDGRFYNYEMELREGRLEYEYKLDAQTGGIVEVETD